MQLVPITTKVVSSNPAYVEVYSIQHYVMKFVSDLRQVRWFSPDTPVLCTNKTERHDITEILLKVVLNIITPPPFKYNNLKLIILKFNICAFVVYLLYANQLHKMNEKQQQKIFFNP
jgi:hypothetical protein